MKKYFLIILVVIVACGKIEKQCDVLGFSCVDNILPSDTLSLNLFDVLDVYDIVISGDWLVIGTRGEESMFTLYNVVDHRIIKGISIGQGPNDMSPSPVIMSYGDNTYVIDYGKQMVFQLNVDSTNISIVPSCDFKYSFMLEVSMLSRNSFITNTVSDSCLLVECDTLGNVLSSIDVPSNSEISKYPYSVQSSAWGSLRIASSDDGKRFACGYSGEGLLLFGEYRENGINTSKMFLYDGVSVERVSEHGRIVYDSNSSLHIGHATSLGDEYVAFTYSGQNRSEYNRTKKSHYRDLLIYQWDGTPYRRIDTNADLSEIAYDKKRGKMYAISRNPEATLLVYDIEL